MTSKYKSVPVEPTLVAWVLYDATADKKYIKMDPTNGSLAIFNTEEAAMSAKRAHSGTDYKRCEYYTAPQPSTKCPGAGCTDQGCPAHYANDYQPTPDVVKLVEALEGLLAIVSDSAGVAGYHMNGDIAEWDEFVEVFLAEEALELYRKQGGDV